METGEDPKNIMLSGKSKTETWVLRHNSKVRTIFRMDVVTQSRLSGLQVFTHTQGGMNATSGVCSGMGLADRGGERKKKEKQGYG